MTAEEILQSVELSPEDIIFSMSSGVAVQILLDFIEEWRLNIQVEKITKEDWKTLIESYADAIFSYHPEDYHQSRAVFLCNSEILKKYGLTDDDVWRIDFC